MSRRRLDVARPVDVVGGGTVLLLPLARKPDGMHKVQVITACDDYGMVMAFTGLRLFHH